MTLKQINSGVKIDINQLSPSYWIIFFQNLPHQCFPVFIPSNLGSHTLEAPSTISNGS